MSAALERACTRWQRRGGTEPTLITRAPGRVNLIGEHTDYNDGFVLPVALPFDIVIAGTALDQPMIEAWSEGFDPIRCDLDATAPVADGWGIYVHGMARLLAESGHKVGGWTACVVSDIPVGASLSSSAALKMAAGLASLAAAGEQLDPTRLALVGQRVENELLGLPSGIMDQLVSASASAEHASLIDCRDLSISNVPLPEAVSIVVMDTGTRRRLVDSQYAARRRDCAAACDVLGIDALRDATIDDLVRITDERVRRRARHVITENARTLDAAAAMKAGDPGAVGRLMSASHASLRNDYEVSGPALDAIVETARRSPGCLGARMTGAGFAGCAVALVRREGAAEVAERVAARYREASGRPGRVHVCAAVDGARVLD